MEVYDIESYNGLFLYMLFSPEERRWYEFEISKYKSDLDPLVKFLSSRRGKMHVSFNGVAYDSQVVQYIVDNSSRWYNLSNTEIVHAIKKFSNKVIEDGNYGLFPPYREEAVDIKQVDLFRIHHFDNENRRCSLKWLQFSMDFENVEESPIPFTREDFTPEEIQECKDYCRNDILSTYEFYRYSIGEVEGNDFYTGINKIQDRLDLIEEMKFPDRAMNWSDVKIGDEINKLTYCKLANKKPWELKEIKENRESTAGFTYGDCIPEYVEFKNPSFKEFFERMKPIRVNLNGDKEVFPFSYNKTNYAIAKGGIHSNEKNRIIICQKGWILRDADVGSQYPHSIIKRGLFPSHLSKLWLIGYTMNRDKRMEYKKRGKLSKKFKGLADMYKLALNGGGFGKTNERTNWQYDPFVQFQCTIGNQFEMLMLVEWMEDAGIHVVSANTDGIVCYFEASLETVYEELCLKWEKVVGNDVQGKLEFADYEKLIQGSVNDYIAIKKDGEVKKKGDFCTSFELNKNSSRRIIPIALERYFVEGIPVEHTIRAHRRIYDFCIGVKASKEYHYEAIDKAGGTETYNRLVRYYVSTNGKRLYKVKNQGSEALGVDRLLCEGGDGNWKCMVANKITEGVPIKNYQIDYQYYIQKAQGRVDALERGSKRKIRLDPNQQSLF